MIATNINYIVPALLQFLFAACVLGTGIWFLRTVRYAHAFFLFVLTFHFFRVASMSLTRGGYLPPRFQEVTTSAEFVTFNTSLLLIAFILVVIETNDARIRMRRYQRSLDHKEEEHDNR
jgi:hypothetical protein